MHNKVDGRLIAGGIAAGSAWLRGEFHGEGDHIDGHHLPLAEKALRAKVACRAGPKCCN